MPKLDLDAIPAVGGSKYPPPFDREVVGRWYKRLGPPAGITTVGVSHVRLEPGAWSSQRHWHESEDEFLVIILGEAVLVDDDGEHALGPGDCAAFPKGERNGHHLQNRSDQPCIFVVVSGGERTGGDYPDIDMRFTAAPNGYVHKDGTPYAN